MTSAASPANCDVEDYASKRSNLSYAGMTLQWLSADMSYSYEILPILTMDAFYFGSYGQSITYQLKKSGLGYQDVACSKSVSISIAAIFSDGTIVSTSTTVPKMFQTYHCHGTVG